MFCVQKLGKTNVSTTDTVNSLVACPATSSASQVSCDVGNSKEHRWRSDMCLPYSLVATWEHLHQGQPVQNVISIVGTSCIQRPQNAPSALERLHCLLHALAPEDARHTAECKSSMAQIVRVWAVHLTRFRPSDHPGRMPA